MSPAPSKPPQGQAEHLARGTLSQQAAQVVAVGVGIAVATALGRTLSLAEFGAYGLVVSTTTYLLFLQGGAATALQRTVAQARDAAERDGALTTAVVVFAGFGALAAVAILGIGFGLLAVFDVSPSLEAQARISVVGIAAVTLFGWPLRAFPELLRGDQRFTAAAVSEASAYLIYGGLILSLALATESPLWVLIILTGSLPAMIGIASFIAALTLDAAARFRWRSLNQGETRAFLRFSLTVSASGASDIVITSLDRAILAALASPVALGLYEAAVRPYNLIRVFQASLTRTVLPAASRYMAEGDNARAHMLLARGTRYVTAATLPVTLVLIVLSEPILVAWLGEKFRDAALGMSILVATWAIASSASVVGPILIAAGRLRVIFIYSWSVAALNLALSLSLTPVLGLEGVIIGTTGAYVALMPVLVSIGLRTVDMSARTMVRVAWLPTYGLGTALVAILVFSRVTLPLDEPAVLVATMFAALALYWLAFYAICLQPDERGLLRALVTRTRSR